jgi:hypothetical protein
LEFEMKVFANLGFRSASGLFSTPVPKERKDKTVEERKISALAKRKATSVKERHAPSACIVYKPAQDQ